MRKFFVSKITDSRVELHEVHDKDCIWLPEAHDLIDLGQYESCKSALLKARELFPEAVCCQTCCMYCEED